MLAFSGLALIETQTGLFTAFLAVSPDVSLETSPSPLYSTGIVPATYSLRFDFTGLDEQETEIKIFVPNIYSAPRNISDDCKWKRKAFQRQVECEAEDADKFSAKFDVTAGRTQPNNARTESWRIEIDSDSTLASTKTVKLQVLPPKAEITLPENNAVISGQAGLLAIAIAGIPDTVEFYYNDKLLGTGEPNSSGQWVQKWDTTNVSDGIYSLKAAACDSAGSCDAGPGAITVEVANNPASKTVSCSIESADSPISIEESSSITLSYQNFGAVPNSAIVDCSVDYAGDLSCLDGTCTFSCGPYASAGIYPVLVSLSAGSETADCGSTNIEVQLNSGISDPIKEENIAPTASIDSPVSGETFYVGQSISFAGSASDPNAGDVLSYFWNFGDLAEATGSSVQYNYTSAGQFTVLLTVKDSSNDSGTDSITLNVIEVPVNNEPEIHSVTASPSSQEEGQAIVFTVNASDPDGDALSYSWDFGDGSVASGKSVPHAYYLTPAKQQQFFAVKATVNDGEFNVSRSVNVTVQKAYFTLNFLQPVFDPSNPVPKGKELAVVLDIRDASGQQLKGLSPRVSVEGTAVAVSESENGTYSGSFTPAYTITNTPAIYAEANAFVSGKNRTTNTQSVFNLAPAEITIANPFEAKTYVLSQEINGLEMLLYYPNGSIVQEAGLSAEFSCREGKSNILFRQGTELDLGIVVDESMSDCMVSFGASDTFGNFGSAEFALPVNLDNPDFRIVVERPDFAFNNLFSFKQPVVFVVSIQSLRESELAVEKMLLKATKVNKEIFFSEDVNNGSYMALLVMPGSQEGFDLFPVSIEAYGTIAGQGIKAVKNVEMMLSNKLGIEFKYPVEGANLFNPSHGNRLIVALAYPDGTGFDGSGVNAVLDDGKAEQQLVFTKNPETGFFESQIAGNWPLGEYTLSLGLLGEFTGNEKSILVGMSQPFDWMLLVYLIIGLFVVFSAMFFARKALKEKSEKLESLRTEQANLKGMIKRLRFEYFKRRITEKEYKERVLVAQQKLATAEKKLSEKKFESKKGKKGQHDAEVERLVKKLAPSKSKYKKSNIYLILLKDKGPEVADRVMKRLFGKRP